MRFTDEETGQEHRLFPSVELLADLQLHQAKFDCDHSKMQLRRRQVGGGAVQIRHQCLRCGLSVGNAVKKDIANSRISPFDKSVTSIFERERASDYRTICLKHLKLQNNHEASHQKEYDAYLASPQWAEKREKVLKRASGVCEGCCEKPATQIHHLTYDHIFEEFIFELVALCDSCHQRLHPRLSSDSETESNGYLEPPCCACRWQSEQDGIDWCGKFDVSTAMAMAEEGPCGPK